MASTIGQKVTITEGNWQYEGIVVAVNTVEHKRKVSIATEGKVIEQDDE